MKISGRKQDDAVSEIIGTVLLISIVVLAGSIIAVTFFSLPQAQKIPSVSALISNQSQMVFIKHVGGDSLPKGTYEILVDGADVTSGITTPSTWSIGNTLTYTKPGTTPPSIVQVVYTGSGSPIIIAVSYFGMLSTVGKGIYMITASAGTGGSISPAGAVPVAYDTNQTFTITNNTGYFIAGVSVDGVSSGSISTYTFTNVTGSHTISATFAQNPVITASAGTGGTITPNGSVSVTYGGNQTFTIANTTGYYIAGVLVDGNAIGSVTTYTFTNVIAAHTINATFAATIVNITASASSGGIISPSGIIPVPYGSNQTFTITNNTGYYNAGVQVDGILQGTITNYTFTSVIIPHTINATFAQNPVINASAGYGGSISPSGSVSVNYGSNQAFSISPNTGYSVSNVSVNGSFVGPVTTYTFTNVTTAQTISANFTINSFNITASSSPGGIISPNGTISVTYGSSQTFTITPNLGQNIIGVVVDGVNQGVNSTYTFTNITTAHTIAASFVNIQNTITASAGTGGTITPSGAVSVYYGTNQTFTITNNTGYYVSGVVVDGSPVGSVTTYTFTNVISSHTIAASFASNPVITASAGSGGVISPSGSVSVNYGGSQTFIITPNTGYSVASVVVDGVSQGAITTYTFSNVQTTHTISATFAINTYTITASSGANGAVTPTGVTTVNYGGSQTYTITPNTGYSVASVVVDGVSQGAITTYTFSNVQTTHTISATFATNTYTITVTQGSYGTISPGTTSVNYGGSQTFSITPNTGYSVASVVVDGSSVGALTSYTFSNVQTTHTISATFAINTYTIAASSGANGAVTPTGVTTVNYGGSQTYTITPNTGYSVANVLVDSVSQGAITSYIFTSVQASHTISATFVAVPPTVTGISPTSGPTAGVTSVTITGTGFTGATAVKFGTIAATSFTVNSATSITATSPAGSAGTVDITVTTPGGASATSSADKFTYASAPTVTGISPTSGPTAGATSVTITGTGFTGATAVKFGTIAATSFTVNSATSITAISPAGSAGTVDITVTTPGGTSATSSADKFTYAAAPTVTGISPTHGPNGGNTKVTITGTGFTSAATVKFGATAGTSVTFVSSTQITANAPAYSTYVTVDVTVTTVGGTSATSANDQYSYDGDKPTVTSISPTTGPVGGGTSVTIAGTGFTSAATVKFGPNAATSVTYISPTQIIATSPAGTGTVDITVTNIDGTSNTGPSDKFTYAPVPVITSSSPSSGTNAGGTSVTIRGSGFTGATAVSFGGTPAASFTVNSASQITATSPAHAAGGPVDITVTTPGGTSATSSNDFFTWQP
jgi:hypothetical protein